ncbi:MAG: hypothetical protein HY291_09110 [Planctomycetes bacterium]|nr:hypothetical protein [Planctomycetota bacterium]
MKSALLSAALFAALQPAAFRLRAEDEEKKPPPVVLRIYDVADIVTLAPDFPGPSADVGPASAANVNLPNAVQPVQANATVQSIADMIRNRIRPDTWDPNQGTCIEERAGMLVVLQTHGIHALVSELLAKIAQDQHRQLCVQALMVDMEQDGLLPFLGKCGKDFTEEDIRATVKKGKLRGAPQLSVLNTQRTHVFSGRKAAYLADYDISGDAPDPVVCEALEGTVLDVRPTLSLDATSATIEVRLTSNENLSVDQCEGMELRAVDLHAKERSSKEDPKAEKMEEPATLQSFCPIQKATADSRRLRTSLECKLGRWTLAAILPPIQKPGEKLAPGKSSLVFLLVDKAE